MHITLPDRRSPSPPPARRRPPSPSRELGAVIRTPGAGDAAPPLSAEPWLEPAAWNCERVRERTAALVGVGGHHALLQRSLAYVREEFPWLSAVRVEDGFLTGLSAVLPEQSLAARKAACVAIRKHYLRLLQAFLGDGLAWKVVGDDWPELLQATR